MGESRASQRGRQLPGREALWLGPPPSEGCCFHDVREAELTRPHIEGDSSLRPSSSQLRPQPWAKVRALRPPHQVETGDRFAVLGGLWACRHLAGVDFLAPGLSVLFLTWTPLSNGTYLLGSG